MSTDTTQQIDPKIVARIKKLHNMAEGAKAVGSLAEADSFMEAVNKTLAAHNLDMSVLNVELHNLTDPMGRDGVNGVGKDPRMSRHDGKTVDWIVDLGSAVAEAHYCASNYSVNGSYIWFYGRKSNRDTAMRMFVYLRDMAERLGWDAYVAEVKRRRKEHGSERGAGQWRLNWLEGFVAEVSHRYRMMRDRIESDKGMSLVLVGVRKEAQDRAHEEVGARWRDIKLPEDQALAGRWAGMSLWDIGTQSWNNRALKFVFVGTDPSELKFMMAFVRQTPWPGMGPRKAHILSMAKELLEFIGAEDPMSADYHDADAREAGKAAARNVNLRPEVLDQPSGAPKRLGGGQ